MPTSAARRADRPRLRVLEGRSASERWAEVTIAWDDTTLHVAHARPNERFVLADDLPRGTRGFALPKSFTPGGDLLVAHEGATAVVVPDEARAFFFDGSRVRTRSDAIRAGMLVRHRSRNAWIFPLRSHRRCRFVVGALRVEVAAVDPIDPVGKPRVRLRRSHWAILAVSAMLHVLVLAAILTLPRPTAGQERLGTSSTTIGTAGSSK